MNSIFFLFVLLAVLFESFVFSIPLTFSLLLIGAVFLRSNTIFFLAFLLGIFLDTALFRVVGTTSLFFIIAFLIVSLYERKFETQTYTFVFFTTGVGSRLYGLFFHYAFLPMQVIYSILVSTLCFLLISPFYKHMRDAQRIKNA